MWYYHLTCISLPHSFITIIAGFVVMAYNLLEGPMVSVCINVKRMSLSVNVSVSLPKLSAGTCPA